MLPLKIMPRFFIFCISLFACSLLRAENFGPISIVDIPSAISTDATTHGYAEVRFQVSNKDTRSHHISLASDQRYLISALELKRVINSVEVPPQSSRMLHLLIPPISHPGSNEVSVWIDGKKQDHSCPCVSPNHFGYSASDSAAVLVSKSGVPASILDSLNDTPTPDEPKKGTPMPTAIVPAATSWTAANPVSEWSESFLGYTRFDGIIISSNEWKELQRYHPAVFKAIRQYTELGGVLGIVGKDWQPPEEWIQYKDSPRLYYAKLGTAVVLDGEATNQDSNRKRFQQLVIGEKNRWAGIFSAEMFRSRRATHFSSHKSSGNQQLKDSLPTVEDYNFSPTIVVILIIVFAVLIGPVNIIFLSKMNRRIWMLWTVPLTSTIAAVLVLAVNILQEGIQRNCSSSSFSLLDQREGSVLSSGYIGFYSSLTPRGITFSSGTEASPCIFETTQGSSSKTVEVLPDGNQFFTGFIQARVPSYFLLRKAETGRKERVLFDWSAAQPTATNGLGKDIEELTVCSPDGKYYIAKNVKAGEKAALQLDAKNAVIPRSETYQSLQKPLNDVLPVAQPKIKAKLSPSTYQAVFEDWNPFLERGIDGAKPFKNRTMVIGIF
jgi:hypothetical protein